MIIQVDILFLSRVLIFEETDFAAGRRLRMGKSERCRLCRGGGDWLVGERMNESEGMSDLVFELRAERERLTRHIESWRGRIIALLDAYEAALSEEALMTLLGVRL